MSSFVPDAPHGTRAGYDRHRCRCDECRAVNAARVRRNRAARLDAARLNHGTRSAYDAGCRCEACVLVRRSIYWRDEGARPHRWRELVTETYRLARASWEQLRESAAFMQFEIDEYVERRGRAPTFRDTLIALRQSV